MMVAGKGVADQHGIAGIGVKRAVGLVDQLIVGQAAAANQRQLIFTRRFLFCMNY